MELRDKVVVITGGSGGIGRAMAAAFLAEGAREVTLADLNREQVQTAAKELGCQAVVCDVTDEAAMTRLVEDVIGRSGQIDLFCSNAGAGGEGVLTDATNDVWQKQWDLHSLWSCRPAPWCSLTMQQHSSSVVLPQSATSRC